jgi:hypothetical protein
MDSRFPQAREHGPLDETDKSTRVECVFCLGQDVEEVAKAGRNVLLVASGRDDHHNELSSEPLASTIHTLEERLDLVHDATVALLCVCVCVYVKERERERERERECASKTWNRERANVVDTETVFFTGLTLCVCVCVCVCVGLEPLCVCVCVCVCVGIELDLGFESGCPLGVLVSGHPWIQKRNG